MNESTNIIQEILEKIGVEKGYRTEALTLLEACPAAYLRDIKLNFNSTLTSEHLSNKECALVGLAVSVNNHNKILTPFFARYARNEGATPQESAEATACASLLAANNVFHRFRHFTKKEKYAAIPARIRMQLMMNPLSGKEFFELMSLAISSVNGCELCVHAHEHGLIKLGTKEERIFDIVRIASLVTAIGKVVY